MLKANLISLLSKVSLLPGLLTALSGHLSSQSFGCSVLEILVFEFSFPSTSHTQNTPKRSVIFYSRFYPLLPSSKISALNLYIQNVFNSPISYIIPLLKTYLSLPCASYLPISNLDSSVDLVPISFCNF